MDENKIDNDENKNLIDDHVEATTGMEEIDNFDFERAMMLMSVQEKVANVGVKATAIGGLASAALNEMNEEAKAIGRRRAEAMAELERKRDEALAVQRRDEEERERAEQEAAAAKTVDAPRAIPNMQASKTADIARDNARRV